MIETNISILFFGFSIIYFILSLFFSTRYERKHLNRDIKMNRVLLSIMDIEHTITRIEKKKRTYQEKQILEMILDLKESIVDVDRI